MRYACIDIGSNTTRLLVAEFDGPRMLVRHQSKVFTCIGHGRRPHDPVPRDRIEQVAGVVADQARQARELGAAHVRSVGTAALRDAPNRSELLAAVHAASGIDTVVLTPEQEARLAFGGAMATIEPPAGGSVAVVDIGGGSSEIAVGTRASGVTWWASFPIGTATLADAHLRADPPTLEELDAVRHHVAQVFTDLDIEAPDTAVAVGGSATSLRRLCGGRLDAAALQRGLDAVAGGSGAEVAVRLGLDRARIRLLPAGILLLGGVAERLGQPLHIVDGGLREGVIRQLAAEGAT